jgi:hypothetical protein
MDSAPPEHNDWPFAQDLMSAVITLRSIVYHGDDVLLVNHNADDQVWEFYNAAGADEENSIVVSLSNMVTRDPSIKDLADLPAGWCACRQTKQSAWVRQPIQIADINPD